MQRALTVGLALVCVCLLFAMSGPAAQRMVTGDGGGSTTTPVPVAVNNFPAVQTVQGNVAVDKTVTVTGSVAVTNLPAVQQVAGTVSVGNLPVDADGNVRTSSLREQALVVPIYYCQLGGTLGGDGTAQLNQGIDFQPIGISGVQANIALNDDPSSRGTTADCLRLTNDIAATAATAGCLPGPIIQISSANIQLRIICAGERNQVVQMVSTLGAEVFSIHPHPGT